jgi:hypothetical protein
MVESARCVSLTTICVVSQDKLRLEQPAHKSHQEQPLFPVAFGIWVLWQMQGTKSFVPTVSADTKQPSREPTGLWYLNSSACQPTAFPQPSVHRWL